MTSTRNNPRRPKDTAPLPKPNSAEVVALRPRAAGWTDVGRLRRVNQDLFIIEPELGLYAVLDGMGGANSGDVAAAIARDHLVFSIARDQQVARLRERHELVSTLLDAYDSLERAIYSAGQAVHQVAKSSPAHQGMGTTAVACLFVSPNQLVVGHAGDSRAYLLRPGRLERLTTDHTGAQRLLEAGQITEDEMEGHATRHVLTRNLGHRDGVSPDMRLVDLQPGDLLLLCSDGLNGELSDDVICAVLGRSGSPSTTAKLLVDTVLDGPARDNVTAVVIAVELDQGAPRNPHD